MHIQQLEKKTHEPPTEKYNLTILFGSKQLYELLS